jgi:hypothetical protein
VNKIDRRRKRRRQEYRDNLRALLSTAHLIDWVDGRLWYSRARESVDDVAREFLVPHQRVAGIVAALSPRNRWERNVSDARDLLRYGPAARVGTVGAHKRAALLIMRGEPWRLVLKGPKTRAFAAALAGDDEAAVIDVWMARALTGGRRDTPRSGADYQDMADAVRYVAAREFIEVTSLQATAWIVARRNRKGVQA